MNCRETLISAEKFICTECRMDLPITNDLENKENELFQKLAFEPSIKTAVAYLFFNEGGIAQKLIHELKYNGNQQLGYELGQMFGKRISETYDPDIIVPVPLYKKKLKQRGYNQSDELAKGIASLYQEVVVRDDLIRRTVNTETQTRKNKLSRWKNVTNIYSSVEEDLSGLEILVVDDVVTTGATIGMLCENLRKANASNIHILCLARK